MMRLGMAVAAMLVVAAPTIGVPPPVIENQVDSQGRSTLMDPRGRAMDLVLDSGVVGNRLRRAAVTWSERVHVEGAAWIRIWFDDVILSPGSTLVISSLHDGERQVHDAASIAAWSGTSAYFNGDTLALELISGPGSAGDRVEIQAVTFEAGSASRGGCGICGEDDRVPSVKNHSGRLSNGCSATIYSTDSCIVTAGHCVSTGQLMQFNVPPSNPDCSTNQPPVADQFPIIETLFENEGVGNDWAVMLPGVNSEGLLPYEKYGMFIPIASEPALNGDDVETNGYGADTECERNGAQQETSGTINGVSTEYYTWDMDTTFGQSGSNSVHDGKIVGIVTHCGCPTNVGTRVDVGDFAWARASLCPPSGACCVGDACLIETSEDCVAMGGHFFGDESACLPETCEYLILNEDDKLLAATGEDGDFFGRAVSIDGNVALISMHSDDGVDVDSGAAFVFRFEGGIWREEQKLVASDGDLFDQFGYSVAIDGDVALVGAPYDDDAGSASGSAYVFRYDGDVWDEEVKLVPGDGEADDNFGYSVAVSGDVVLIGAWADDDNGGNAGSAYAYRYVGDQWVADAKFLPEDGEELDVFGAAVAISGDAAVIGAYQDDDMGLNAGAAYIVRHDGTGWVDEAKLRAYDASDSDFFGSSVDISGDTVIIGAWADDDNGDNAGSAYVFEFDGTEWVLVSKFLASDGSYNDHFGVSVSITGENALVGAGWDDDSGSASGSAYLYDSDGNEWLEVAKLLASDGAEDVYFGVSVAIAGDIALVGAPFDDEGGTDAGAAYVFDFEPAIPGGCCIHKSCEVTSEAACTKQGGTFLGEGTTCVDDPCAPPCPEDVTSDGVVNVSDILAIIAAWGVCDGCPEDIDGSGRVDVTDILAVIAAWGPCP